MFAAGGWALIAQPSGLRGRQALSPLSGLGATVKTTERPDQVKRSYWPRPEFRQPDAHRSPSCAAILSNNSKCRPIRRLGGADHLDACSAPRTAWASAYPATSLNGLMTLQADV